MRSTVLLLQAPVWTKIGSCGVIAQGGRDTAKILLIKLPNPQMLTGPCNERAPSPI